MGNIFSYFNSNPDVVLRFEEIAPPEGDDAAHAAFQEAQSLLEQYKASADYLNKYSGNEALVQKSMKHPKDETIRKEAFEGMFPNIRAIKGFYDLSQSLDECVCKMLRVILENDGASDDSTSPISNPALSTRLALIFEAIFLFDWAKMSKPAVQNDFSFYRRELSKNPNYPKVPVDDSLASVISMFVAQANPLLTSLATSLTMMQKTSPKLTTFLADFVNMCCSSGNSYYKNGKGDQDQLVQTLYLSMVTAATLYDRIDTSGGGAFTKTSPVDMKKVIQALKAWNSEHKDSCLSTLQYSTRTFNKAPNNIRKLFP